jgi:hypothetical protein
MKKFLLSFIISIYILPLFAQDTTIVKHKHRFAAPVVYDSLRPFFPKEYLIYNYTAQATNNVFSQQFRGDASNRIIIDGNYYSNSIGVPANIGYNLLFNRPISNALINRADKHLGNEVKFEENLNTGLTYEHYFKKADLTLVVGYNFRQMLDLAAPKQAFETVFYGNAHFEGDTANLSNIHFDYYQYNQYSIGVIKRIDYGKYQMELGVTGSFLQVSNNVDIETGNTSIYTAPYGEYIDIDYNLTYNQATGSAPKFFALNGLGASGDFHLAFANKDKWKISFDVKDLGIISFRRYEVNYSGSNNVNFQGIVIPNLLNFSTQTFDTLNLDSALLSKLPSKTNNQYSIFLPFTANLAFSKPLLHDRLVLTVGAQYRFLPNYYVYGYVKANYFIQPDMIISASAGAGGYSLFDLGFEFAKSWKYFDMAVGSSNLIGLIVPSAYSGSGFYIRLGTTF